MRSKESDRIAEPARDLPAQPLTRVLGCRRSGRVLEDWAEADPRLTTTDRDWTSTDQTRESPASTPRTVATDCGTVVFRESEPDCDRNALDSNSFGIATFPEWRSANGHKSNLYRGRRLDLILKYWRQFRPNDSPMSGTRGHWDQARELRAIRMVTSQRYAVRPTGRVAFRVRSEGDTRDYHVAVDGSGWSCNCPDWEDRRTPCKHIVGAVVWLDPNPPQAIDEPLPDPKPPRRRGSWHSYDKGQELEHVYFDRYLWDLLGPIPDKISAVGKRGRPAIPLRTQVLVTVRKVHLNESSRRGKGLIVALNSDGKGILPRVPNYAIPSRFLNRQQTTGLLMDLVERSGLILKDIEDGGTVAIDSSGFSTSCMGAYFTEKYDQTRRHEFVKLHLAIGVKTHIVLAAKVTDEHGADCPEFIPLIRRVHDVGHTPARVVADKAYLSRDNLAEAAELGMDPYVPFKINSRGLSHGSPMWTRKYHEFMLRRDEFDEAYHARSNVEATFSALKRKLGEPLFSKTEFARMNELLARVLAYNIGVVIAQMVEHGIEETPTGLVIPRPPRRPEAQSAA